MEILNQLENAIQQNTVQQWAAYWRLLAAMNPDQPEPDHVGQLADLMHRVGVDPATVKLHHFELVKLRQHVATASTSAEVDAERQVTRQARAAADQAFAEAEALYLKATAARDAAAQADRNAQHAQQMVFSAQEAINTARRVQTHVSNAVLNEYLPVAPPPPPRKPGEITTVYGPVDAGPGWTGPRG